MYDIIGDIHGQADELEQLLLKMGYQLENRVYRHPERKAVFVGDFIDRGKQEQRTIAICRPMIEQGSALAVMGNHEFNAICYATPGTDGNYLRPHKARNVHQHAEFIAEFPFESPEHQDVINWFRTLPLFLDLGELRVIHAVWDQPGIAEAATWLDDNHCLIPEAYAAASDPLHPLYEAIEKLLKGIELELPSGFSFQDKNNIPRTSARIRWWDENATNWQNATIGTGNAVMPDIPLPEQRYHYWDNVPLFVGHYWLNGDPAPLSKNVACVDYSVASSKGKLVAYRWSGEKRLDKNSFVWVERNQ